MALFCCPTSEEASLVLCETQSCRRAVHNSTTGMQRLMGEDFLVVPAQNSESLVLHRTRRTVTEFRHCALCQT